jgi:hypothetical protein
MNSWHLLSQVTAVNLNVDDQTSPVLSKCELKEMEITGPRTHTGNQTWKFLNFTLIYVFETSYIMVATAPISC